MPIHPPPDRPLRTPGPLAGRLLAPLGRLALVATLVVAFASVVWACPPGRGTYRGGHAEPDCHGQRLGAVRWDVRSSHPAVAYDRGSRVLVEVRLRADKIRAAARRPVAVALVLDRSGSMRGRKWQDAVDAARAAVRRLERGDVLTIVSYATDVRVDWEARRYEPRDQDEILRIIDRMEPGGSTYLEGGLRRAAEQIGRYADGERPTRIVLVSDGNANVGVQSPQGLQQIARNVGQQGVIVSTVGLGLDYNEDLMTALADGGSGSYYYVRDSDRLAETFRTELDRMMASAARRIAVRIQPAQGVHVLRVLGYPHESVGDGGIEVPLGELSSEGERSLLVELDVRCDARGRRRLATVELELYDVSGERLLGIADVDVDATDDMRRVESERDMEVVGRHEEHRLADEMRESAEMVSRGEGGAAQQRLRAAAQRAREVARKGGSKALAKAADEAESRAEAAPSAAAGPSDAREDYKKSMKAKAYDYQKR